MKQKETHTCPICHSPTQWDGNKCRPFCSERCKTTDLGNWASQKYALPDHSRVNLDDLDLDPDLDDDDVADRVLH